MTVFTPSDSSLSFSANFSPSTKSIAGAPSRVASLIASRVNFPVVTNKSPLFGEAGGFHNLPLNE